MANLPKIALGAWAWGNDGTFGNSQGGEMLKDKTGDQKIGK